MVNAFNHWKPRRSYRQHPTVAVTALIWWLAVNMICGRREAFTKWTGCPGLPQCERGGEGRGVDTRVHVLRPSTSGVIQPVLEELTKRSSSFDGRHNSEIWLRGAPSGSYNSHLCSVSCASRDGAVALFSSWRGVDVFRDDLLMLRRALVYPLCSVKKQ